MFISLQMDSLTEAERYFNPLYLIVQKGKEHLKQQLVRGSICDCDTTLPNRRIGIFSVAADRYVTFSQGNLQYFPAAKLWKFADNQYDILGNANQHLSPTFRNWVDLFGYSANNTTAPFGISTSTNNADYTGDFVDWGNNWICGDKPNTWRTLSKDEWEYLLEHRVNASSLYAVAQVANVSGMIILPDNWILPSGITFQPGFHQNDLSFAQHQTFTEQQWALMERAGAVFLPAAGIVSSNIIRSPMEGAHYQSSDKDSNSTNYWFGFRSSYYTIRSSEVGTRRSVRLVRDTQLVDCDTVVKSLQLSVTDTTVYQGESFTLNVQTGYCIDGAIQLSLSDNSLAQIEQLSLNSYHITTAKTGTLVLTATAIDYPNVTAQCTITIRDQHLSGVFSIGGDKHIIFSPGNLQYLPATCQWRFAETQYQYMGENNTHLSTDYNHWIDLFGYSANNTTAPFGISTSTNNADYAGDFVDWGTQTISSDKPGKWRTLNKDEWEYLLNKRDNATQLRSHAQIDSINGFIFLPDNWVCPEGIDFEPATRYESQKLSLKQWNKLEQAGAVFLPAAGRRQGKELLNSNEHGNYHSSTRRNSTYADYFAFTDADVYVNAIYTVTRGRSIRLVYDTVIPEYVDLGLSVKWATFNVGAKAPEEAGYFFAWGETTAKKSFSWNSYKWCNKTGTSMTKYCSIDEYGQVDNKITLDLEDDAAHVHWKEEWRIPTVAECQELISNCKWETITINGVSGIRGTSKIEGYTDNSIFLPSAGVNITDNVKLSGYFQTRELASNQSNSVYCMNSNSSSSSSAYIRSDLSRHYGYNVRPVYGALSVSIPRVTTKVATQIRDHSALVGGQVTHDGGCSVTEYGIVYSTHTSPTIDDNKHIASQGMGLFYHTLSSLQPHTQYYVRAYATNSQGTAYGSEISFTTSSFTPQDTTGYLNGYAYVDLGLPSGTKWATCNVGASQPEDYGNYYAWGETETKDIYNWTTYKWSDAKGTIFSKYVQDPAYGTIDNKTNLDTEDDAATANWGEGWRTPNTSEWTELRNNCTWAWTTRNGIKGKLVTSNKNGNSIFLPAAGRMDGNKLVGAVLSGRYQTSVKGGNNLTYHYHGTYFSPATLGNGAMSRCYGLSIRAVYGPKTISKPGITIDNITQTSDTSICIVGRLTSEGGSNIIEHGVVYSTNSHPTIENANKCVSNGGIYRFTCNITGLQADRTYYARAYATNAAGTAYSSQKTVKVLSTTLSNPTGIENGHGYVDLGLSVKWATCNIGATQPEHYGDYYAWGETQTKDTYNWTTYQWCNSADTMLTKYCASTKYGTVDYLTTLERTDDAAALWGENWHMPTEEEWEELRTQCTWHWITINNVSGYKIIGKNGNSIFLPAAGYRINNKVQGLNSQGSYWFNILYTDLPRYAQDISFEFKSTNSPSVVVGYNGRYCGLPIRPVCDAVPSTKHYCYGFTQEQWDNATASWGHGGRGHAPADQSCIQGTMVYGIRLKVSRAGSLNVYKVPTLLETTEENFELVATLTTNSIGLQDFDFPQPIYIATNEYLVFGKPSEDDPTLVPCYITREEEIHTEERLIILVIQKQVS